LLLVRRTARRLTGGRRPLSAAANSSVTLVAFLVSPSAKLKGATIWAWGSLVVAMLLTRFLSQQAEADPVVSTVSFVGSVLILVALTIVTWVWLGRKDEPPADRRRLSGGS
jgi:hypothetical protein